MNYSFDHYNEFKLSGQQQHHLQQHAESGYDSLLATSSLSFSNSYLIASDASNASSDSSLFSQPSTPAKSTPPVLTNHSASFTFNGNNSSTSPDFKQQYVADINSFYFKSLRSGGGSESSSYSNSSEPFLSSCSQSPSKYCPTTDSYIHKRDTFNSKLLRSPAFKLEQSPTPALHFQTERPSIKSFSSRFVANLPTFSEPVVPKKTTPTEEEFMALLIQNHHLPGNPEFLIGRGMGIEHVNMLTELNKRSMNNIVDQIFSHLSPGDLVRVGCVSREWRSLMKENAKFNKERVRCIKQCRHAFETSKENHGRVLGVNVKYDEVNSFYQKSVQERRQAFKKSADYAGAVECSMEVESSIFASLDQNRLNNQRRPLLERQFQQISITEDTIFRLSPQKRSPLKRQSPLKRCVLEKSTSLTTSLICSKKSKKNLKRL